MLKDFILCNQCKFYHESHQAPYTDKLLKWNRYTKGELDLLFGAGRWGNSCTTLLVCPSGVGPAVAVKVSKSKKAA